MDNTNDNEFHADSSLLQESSSDDEVVLQCPQSKPSTSQAQAMQQMYMPYVEGPKMDWTASDSLYHRFLKWKIKCENMLDCGLAMLSEARKCKKVVVWSGAFEIDQYVSWYLPQEELSASSHMLVSKIKPCIYIYSAVEMHKLDVW